MWLKAQKIIRFIPGINLITFISWIIFGAKKKVGAYHFAKNIVIMLALAALVIMISSGLKTFASNEIFKSVMNYISIAIYTYIISFVSVNEQNNIANGTHEE
ncbi:MAG: hypothetical protein E7595_06695 [Ruminococcaceae bacterium]|nr:hypothetical protein [Oscillospiraceae bacterium]